MESRKKASRRNLLKAVGGILLVAVPVYLLAHRASPLSPFLPEALDALKASMVMTALAIFGYVAFVAIRAWWRTVYCLHHRHGN